MPRPLVQHPRAPADRQPNARPEPDGAVEDFARLVEVVSGIEQTIDFRAIPRPILNLEEVVHVRNQRVVGFFIRQVAHRVRHAWRPIRLRFRFTAGAGEFLILTVIAADRYRSPDSLPKIRDQRKRLSLFGPVPQLTR